MITIVLENNGCKRKVVIDGHADYEEVGKDIVCAGVSTLVQTYESFMDEMSTYGRVHVCKKHIMSGHFEHECIVSSGWTMAAFDMLSTGLKGIAEAYPQFVKIF